MAAEEQVASKTCQYKSQLDPDYKCNETPLETSPEGYCIFHDRNPDKDEKEFKSKLIEQLEGHGGNDRFSFVGYCFSKGWGAWGKVLEEDVDFREAEFQRIADFRSVKFQGNALFWDAKFKGGASFWGAEFQGALFRGAEFLGGALFWDAAFQGNADFTAVEFQGNVDFRNVKFQGSTGFGTAKFNATVSFRNARFTRPRDAEIAFRKARRSHEESGDRFEANYYFRQEMVAKRRQRNKLWQWPFRFLEWLLVDLTCAYGISYARVIFSALVIILGAALILAFAGNIALVNSNREFQSLSAIQRLLYAGYFSIITFTTLGYGDIHPIGKLTRTVASVEAFIGTFMMALFVVVFARKYMR